jgi:hypothetical protein
MGEVIPFRSNPTPSRSAQSTRVPSAMRASAAPRHAPGPRPDPLWREVAGSVLRDERRRQQRTLAQVAERAGMSVQYLSEVERGRKEASSEMLGAACGALGLSLAEFAGRCARTITSAAARPSGPVLLAA